MTPHTPGHMQGADDVQGVSIQGLPAFTPATSVLEFDAALESAASEYTCNEPGAGTEQQQLFLLPALSKSSRLHSLSNQLLR